MLNLSRKVQSENQQVICLARRHSRGRRCEKPPETVCLGSSIDPVLVAVDENVAEYKRFHLVHRHAVGGDSVEKFLHERGEKALHSRVVVAVRDTAETLRDAAVHQLLLESVAGVLDAAVGV